MPAEWISAAEAAQRLGVKQASLYSYVSRGVLTRRKAEGSRTSLFSATEVEGLARRGRPRRAPGAAELVIETELTEITGDQLRYRGRDAIGAGSRAQLRGSRWPAVDRIAGRARRALAGNRRRRSRPGPAAQAALPAGTLPLERLQVIVPALAAADPLRLHLDTPASSPRPCLIAGMADCLPLPGMARPVRWNGRWPGGRCRLAARPAGQPRCRPAGGRRRRRHGRRRHDRRAAGAAAVPGRPGPGLVGALRAALVLLADHELAASTLAARVAASVRADPYAVVATGLGAVGGALHGGASFGAEVMLRSASQPAEAARVVGDLLRRGERIPGFGHFVYRGRDPRAAVLMDLLREAAPRSERLAVADAVHRRGAPARPARAEHRLRAGGAGHDGRHDSRCGRGRVRGRPRGRLARARAGGVCAQRPDPPARHLHRASRRCLGRLCCCLHEGRRPVDRHRRHRHAVARRPQLPRDRWRGGDRDRPAAGHRPGAGRGRRAAASGSPTCSRPISTTTTSRAATPSPGPSGAAYHVSADDRVSFDRIGVTDGDQIEVGRDAGAW